MTAHRIRPREDWLDPKLPWDHVVNGKGAFYVCPPFRGWPSIRDIVVHYPGADWADPEWADINGDGRIDESDTVALLRAGHRMYLMGASRGYSYGYGFKIGVLGDIWEIRGWDYANAANLGDAAHGHVGWNNWSISIQIVVDEANEANALQVSAVNWLIDELIRRKGADMNLTYHGAGQYTACCGAGIIGQIKARTIGKGLSGAPVVIDPPTPPTPEDVMSQHDYKGMILNYDGHSVRRVVSGRVAALGPAAKPIDRTALLDLINEVHVDGPSPFKGIPGFEDTGLDKVWNARPQTFPTGGGSGGPTAGTVQLSGTVKLG